MACGIGTEEIYVPADTYIAQPITINETAKISAITMFASYATNLVTAELAITTAPIINQEDIIYTYSFTTPWWCSPRSWATPITAQPNITLRRGTYYIILTFPTQGQTICEPIPNTPRALLINATTGQVIKQLPCTLGTIITSPQNASDKTQPISIAMNIMNNQFEINGNTELTINTETKNLTNLVLIINVNQTQPNAQLIIKLRIMTQDITKPQTQWYLIPTIGLTPAYTLLILAIIILMPLNALKIMNNETAIR